MSKRKRTRASSRHDPDEEDAAMNEASEDESEEELPPRKSRKTSSKPASEPAPLPRQSILGSDDSEDEDQEQDLDSSDDEEMATQSRSASERRGGTVEEIILENFMCHKHLKTTLGPKINFLTGPNGSGKSAVLVALAVGLGAKTSFTNRGKRLDSVINQNEDYTRVTITIWNGDRDPFKHDEYGDRITVERYIRRGGGGSYKVKDCHGRTVTTTRTELLQLIEHYNIQVDNPCAILMQDTSRQYLAESTPKSKYMFYLKATQLAQILEDYQFINVQVGTMEGLLKRRKDTLSLMENGVKELEAEYHDIQKLRTLETDIANLKDKLAWAMVDEKQKQLSKQRAKLEELEGLKTKYSNNISKINAKREEEERKGSEFDTNARDINARVEQLVSERNQLQAVYKAAHNQFRQCKADIDEQLQTKRAIQTRRRKAQEHIDSARKEAMRSTTDEDEAFEAKIANLTQQKQQCEEEQRTLQASLHEKTNVLQGKRTEARKYQQSLDIKRKQIGDARQKIEQAKRSTDNPAFKWGRQMPALLDAIERNQSRFRIVPIGPIGMELKLKESKWGQAVDAALGSILSYFIVDSNGYDEKILKELGNRVGMNTVNVILQKYENNRYDIRGDLPQDVRTVEATVTCSSPMVFNVLVDQATFHNAALVKDQHEAERVVSRDARITCYLPDGSKVFKRSGATNFNANTRPSNRLATDMSGIIHQYEAEVQHLSEELDTMERQANTQRREIAEIERELKPDQARISSLGNQIRQIDREITNLQAERNNRPEPPDVEELEQRVREFDEQLEQINRKHSESVDQLEERKKAVDKAKVESESNNEELGKLTKTMESNSTRMDQMQNSLHKLESLYNDYSTKLDNADRAYKQAKASFDSSEEELQEHIQSLQNSDLQPRENFPQKLEPSGVIDRRITELEIRLKTQLSEGGRSSVDEVMRELADAKKKYNAVSAQYGALEEFCKLVKKQLKVRINNWRQIRRLTARLIQNSFTSFLSQKNYTGNLKFNNKEETLDITVSLEKLRDKSSSHAQTVNSLSGGERSFSTVSLLMALWGTMETPFTAMDEFDVFMDQISRMKSTQMLLSFARGCSTRQQFIFITPQSLQTVEPAPDLHIVRMHPPRP